MSKYTVLADGGRIRNNETNAYIPKDISNVDYVEYLEWVEDGGVAVVEDPLPKKRQQLQRRLQDSLGKRVAEFPHFVNQTFDLAYTIYLVNKKVEGVISEAELQDLETLISEFIKVKGVVEKAKRVKEELETAEDPETVELEL